MKRSLFLLLILIAFNGLFGQSTVSKNQFANEKAFQKILDKSVDGKKVFGTNIAIKKDSLIWFGSSGDLSIDQH